MRLIGSFDVSGFLTSGTACCIKGDLNRVKTSDSTGSTLLFDLGSFELELTFLQGIRCMAESTVTICNSGKPDTVENAKIDIDLDWGINLIYRGGLVNSRLAPLSLSGGLCAGLTATRFSYGEGRSPSAMFDLEEVRYSFGGIGGAFASAVFSIGSFNVEAGLEYFPIVRGFGYRASAMTLGTLGVGMRF
jgi:hypothetical protein